jgi:hypothetical protein
LLCGVWTEGRWVAGGGERCRRPCAIFPRKGVSRAEWLSRRRQERAAPGTQCRGWTSDGGALFGRLSGNGVYTGGFVGSRHAEDMEAHSGCVTRGGAMERGPAAEKMAGAGWVV